MLQQLVAKEVGATIGWHHHFVNNLHIYNNKINSGFLSL